MKKLWFKSKRYGLGWTPATWQGWVILMIYVLLIIASFFYFNNKSHSTSDTLLNFIPTVILLSLLLINVCYRTGEKPEWKWGNKKNTPKK